MQNHEWQPVFDGERLRLSFAVGEYDHVRDLCGGQITANGISISPLFLPTEEIFYRFLRFREWEVSEVSFAKYVAMRSQGDDSLIAIPVFPSRVFRQSSIYVRQDSDLQTPADLAGRCIGIPEWAQTAAVYTRGLLSDSYGVDLRGIQWLQAGVNQAGRVEKVKLALPDGIRVQSRPDTSLDDMLQAGEIDAMFSAHPPQSFERGEPWIKRLFSDSISAEQAYFKATGIYPIMHVIVIRDVVLKRFPWVAMNLFAALNESKLRSQSRLAEYTASRVPLPWVPAQVAAAQAMFGPDPFPYGVEPNRVTLEAFLNWAHLQGVMHKPMAPEDLFAPGTLSQFKI